MAAFPQVPGYEIQSELGRGGMAVVYSAIETGLDRRVAIKVVSAEGGDPEGHILRLENEARGLAALHHPHIVDLYRFGRLVDGSLFYVMPLLTGGSLENWPKPVPEERVVALLENLLDALSHAHAADIIHRDIKPANILFDRHDRPLLADFGAAFMRQRTTRLTSHGGAIGSSGYMSPEQARGQDVDARSDLYSTAVLAFELLTGRRPYEGPDDLSTALAQLEQPVPRLPPALKHWQAFFDRALAVTPEHRFPSTAAMRSAIRNLRPAPTPRRTGWMIALASAVVLLGVFALAQWRASSPAETASVGKPASQPRFGTVEAPPEHKTYPGIEASSETPKQRSAPAAVGDRFSDQGGPELALARAAKGARAALAVMAAPVDAATYQRYAKDRRRKQVTCTNSRAPAQGCLDLATANDLAKWLSKQTDQHYRVPTRTELGASIAQLATTSASAWTSTCNEVRVARPRNVGQRSWAGVRKLFGNPKPRQYDTRCDGYYTVKLDGRGKAAKAQGQASPSTVVVLVRDLAAGESRTTAKN